MILNHFSNNCVFNRMSNLDLCYLTVKNITIGIDGPIASGKSSLGKLLAEKLNINYLDSGDVYRILTSHYYREKKGSQKSINQEKQWLKEFKQRISFENKQIYFDKKPIETVKLYQPTTDQHTIALTTRRCVRATVNTVCQKIIKNRSFVVVGRDANTVVCPFANYKFFLTANLNKRIQRKQDF